jgi:hypothetical protein
MVFFLGDHSPCDLGCFFMLLFTLLFNMVYVHLGFDCHCCGVLLPF